MKTYSSLDLLGNEYEKSKRKNSIFQWIECWLDIRVTEAELTVTIPHSVYLRTRLICDYIRSVYDSPMNTSHFINILYVDFIHRHMKKHNPRKMYDELTKYDFSLGEVMINDPMNNKKYTYQNYGSTEIEIDYTVSKKNIERGEIILAELDELLGIHFTVEELLSKLWINFIQSFSDGNNEKAIDKLLKIAAKNF
ncbi:hypothetical protein AAGG74_17080 [Bacillus mexicanus]|uniref:hypothetical protein n=1 Tax=Bacillus mexicanus TaxID=2834415 RepID=UPI003D1DC57C